VTGSPVRVRSIGVVVPARNEESRLARCLAAVSVSAESLRKADVAAPRVRVLVVVDGSTDGTERIARHWPGVEVLISSAGRVGAARRAGAHRVLQQETRGGVRPRNVWIACTDADSVVPPDWLITALRHARSGVELLLGTVRPDPRELADGLLAAWRLRHMIADGHPHVHGANLGVRGDSYLAVGGFQEVATGEDVLLSVAVRGAGGLVVSTGASPVLTSGRTRGRAPEGMAGYLRDLRDGRDLREGRELREGAMPLEA
jgi:glycosyltransferase involved in cell wall biosynthesis